MLSQSANSKEVKKVKTENSCIGFLNKTLTNIPFEKSLVGFRPYLKIFDSEAEDVNMKIN